jgi:agmatinase
LTENVYLTIDIDGLDPSLVPTTGTPEPGGFGWYEVLTLIRKLARKTPRRRNGFGRIFKTENSDAPAFLCAKLVYKTLAYIFSRTTRRTKAKVFRF